MSYVSLEYGFLGVVTPRREPVPSRMKVFLPVLLAALLGVEQGEMPSGPWVWSKVRGPPPGLPVPLLSMGPGVL